MTTFDDFRNEWQGRRIDYDHTLGYQCVDLIRQYFLECFGLSGGGGVPTAIAYWTNTPADVLSKFSKDGSGSVQKGDVVMLRTLGHSDYTGDGHIGIATGNGDPNSIEILEQNGLGSGTGLGGDAIRTRFVPRNRLAGVLRAIPAAPPQTPAQTPADYMQYVPASYNMTKRTNKNPTNWWNLSNDSTNIDNFHPAATLDNHAPFTVGGYAINTHFPQYRYAMTPEDYGRAVNGNYSTNNGVNDADLEDIPAEPVYVPPAAPITVPAVSYYDLLTTVMWFKSDQNALDRYDGQGTLDSGTYVQLKVNGNAVQLTRRNTDTTTYWINSMDNKVPVERVPDIPQPTEVPTLPVDPPPAHDEPVDPPLPTPITDVSSPLPTGTKPQYNWIRDDKLPVRLTSTNSIPVTIADMEGRWPTQPFPAHRTEDYSMYTVVKGREYWLPDRTRQKGYMYALSVDFLPDEQPIKATLTDRNGNGRADIIDIFDNGLQGFIETSTKYFDGIKAAVTTVAPKIEPVRQRVSKTIDGFSAKRKK